MKMSTIDQKSYFFSVLLPSSTLLINGCASCSTILPIAYPKYNNIVGSPKVFLFIALGLVVMMYCATAAYQKNRNIWGWSILSF